MSVTIQLLHMKIVCMCSLVVGSAAARVCLATGLLFFVTCLYCVCLVVFFKL